MSEQVELWPKPIMYGTGFKITTHTNQYQVFQEWIDQLIMSMYEARNETLSEIP